MEREAMANDAIDCAAPLDDVRILVVEDDPLVAWKLSSDLGRRGALVYSPREDARGVEQAFDTTSLLSKVDAAVLDVELGGGTCEQIASRLTQAGIPFVFHTGSAEAIDGCLLRFDAPVIVKPAHVDEIVSALRRTLARPSARRPA